MRTAETVLNVIRERGERGLPLEDIYRQLYNRELYLRAYGRLYSNQGAMTRGYVNRCVNVIRRRPSQPLIQWRFHPHTVHLDRRLGSTQGPSDA